MATVKKTTGNASSRNLGLILKIGVGLLVAALLFEGYQSLTSGNGKITEFQAKTLDGKPWALAEHRGKNPIILNFFATWCGPCRIEFPQLVALQRKYGPQGLQVVLVTKEPAAVLKEYPELTKEPVTFITDGEEISDAYGIDGIPHTFVFNRKGEMVKEIEGYAEGVLEEVEKHLK